MILFSDVLLLHSISTLCQGGFQALARHASEERFLQRAEQDQTYIGVSGDSYFMYIYSASAIRELPLNLYPSSILELSLILQ